jgi:hypothetical protein
MADSKSSGAPPEEPGQPDDPAAWEQFEARLRQISPRFELQAIVAQLTALVRRRAKPRAPWFQPHEPLSELVRAAARQLAELARQDGATDLANGLGAAARPKRERGRPRQSNDNDTGQLLLEFCDVVKAQVSPDVDAATEILAGQEPWRSRGDSPAAIKMRLIRYLKRGDEDEAGGLLRRKPMEKTLAEFAKDIWQAKQAEE